LLLAIAIVAMCFSLLILTVIPGQAASVLLSWNAPKANADGTSLTDLAGYKVYSGTSPGNYTSTLDVGNVVSISMGGLQDGQLYYFAVTAYDSMGLESGFSNEASVTPSLDTPIPPPPPLASPGLVAAYGFEEGSGTTVADASGNGNTGSLMNGLRRTTGKMGGGLSFDGVNDYVAVPNSSSLDISGTKITISLWANITDTGNDLVLLSKVWFSSLMLYPWHQYGIEFDGNGAKTVDFYFADVSGALRTFSMTAPLGVWTHIAFTYDGATVKGYVDGVQKLSVPETRSIQARGNELRLGVDGAFGQAFKGQLDEVRIYNRALSASEILLDMNHPIN